MTEERTLGIDVSRWQDDNSTPQQIDFIKAYKAGAKFVFIKGSQSNWADLDFIYNWNSSKNAGLLRGAYHFLVWEMKPEIQAQFFAGLLKNDIGELPPVVDFEWWQTTPSNALDILWAFIAELKKLLGVNPIIYTAASYWMQYGRTNSEWKKFPLWIANYDVLSPKIPLPWEDYTFWQYSSHGDGLAFGAESLNIDLNWFNGNYNDLLKFAGINSVDIPDESSEEQDTEESENAGLTAYVNYNMNVRSGPSIYNSIIGKKYVGDIVNILDISGNDAWVKIGENEWICAKLNNTKFIEIK
jgi:lysozyme